MDEASIHAASNLPLAVLEKLRDDYDARNDRAGADAMRRAINLSIDSMTQTEEMERSGRLYERIVTIGKPPSVRQAMQFVGDPNVWLEPFKRPGMTVTLDTGLCTGRNGAKYRDAAGILRHPLDVHRNAA